MKISAKIIQVIALIALVTVGGLTSTTASSTPAKDRVVYLLVELLGKVDRQAWSDANQASGYQTEFINMAQYNATMERLGEDNSVKGIFSLFYLSYFSEDPVKLKKFVIGYINGAKKSGVQSAKKLHEDANCVVVEMITKTEAGEVPMYALLTLKTPARLAACYRNAANIFAPES